MEEKQPNGNNIEEPIAQNEDSGAQEKEQQVPDIEERDATLDEEPILQWSEDEQQERILEDAGLNAFQKFCARQSEKRWTLLQRLVGALMGVIAGVSLFWDTLVKSDRAQQGGIFTMPLVIALVVAMIVPNIIEHQGKRSVPKLRIAMVISLAAVIVLYFIVVGVQTGFHFS